MAALPGVELLYPVEANACFLGTTADIKERLKAKGWHFYKLPSAAAHASCAHGR